MYVSVRSYFLAVVCLGVVGSLAVAVVQEALPAQWQIQPRSAVRHVKFAVKSFRIRRADNPDGFHDPARASFRIGHWHSLISMIETEIARDRAPRPGGAVHSYPRGRAAVMVVTGNRVNY
jgi:hypothetical protein